MSMRRRLAFIPLLLLIACGDKPKPVTPSASADSGVETFGEVNPADLAELDAGALKGDAGSTTADTPPAGGGGGGGAATPAPPPDECTPVGVDFEKRARPKLKECYAEGKKKDPNLQGTVRITVEISMLGKIKSTKIVEKTLPDPVANCMLKVIKATPLPEATKCWGKSLTIPMTFPTPK
jgi:hypothetical protein